LDQSLNNQLKKEDFKETNKEKKGKAFSNTIKNNEQDES
jgi:hypothetical protein